MKGKIMEITSFNPMIVTKDSASVIAFFEAMGFEQRHKKTGINDSDVESVRMKYTNEDGKVFHVDIASSPVPQDITSIRMNVSDFDEAFNMLKDRGFTNTQGDKITETGSSMATMMASPSGYTISVIKHIKEHD